MIETGGTLAFAVVSAAVFVVALVVSQRIKKICSPRLFVGGVLARIFGSLVSHWVIMEQYHGVADAVLYYRRGLDIAASFWAADVTGFLGSLTGGDRWWGTPFVETVSGLVLAFIGPNLKAEFLFFSLLSFAGLVAIAEAVRRADGSRSSRRFSAFVFFWPSLWFWPSMVGKEALVILGIGLTVFGYVGRPGRPKWAVLSLGVALTFCCRPHVAVLLLAGLLSAHLLRPGIRLSLVRATQLGLLAVVTWLAFMGMAGAFGIEEVGQQGISEFVELRAENTLRGGSSLGSAPASGGTTWMAIPNIWFRPFPWEVSSFVSAVAAGELLAFWVTILILRRRVLSNFRFWRFSSSLRLALPVLLGYSLMLGLVIGNLGIIVRQRAVVLPLAFLFATVDVRRRLKREI